ncbi:MAG: hypothetical protein GC180_07625 [Bacteroidetes bacterium]|nr:hypothetical protein [Bacteroidota bacterium]
MKRKTFVISIISLLLIGNGLLLYMVFHPASRMLHEGPKELIIEKLHFDAEQIAAYDDLIEIHRKEVRRLQEDIGRLKNELFAHLSDEIAPQTFDSLTHRIGYDFSEIERVNYRHFQEIKKLCKPEQMQAFNKLTHELSRLFSPGPPNPGRRRRP